MSVSGLGALAVARSGTTAPKKKDIGKAAPGSEAGVKTGGTPVQGQQH